MLVILRLNARLEVIDAVTSDPNLNLPHAHMAREVRDALRSEGLICGRTPALALNSLSFFLPARDSHGCRFVVAGLSLGINGLTHGRKLAFVILSDHFNINLLVVCNCWLRGRRW